MNTKYDYGNVLKRYAHSLGDFPAYRRTVMPESDSNTVSKRRKTLVQ